MNSVNPKRITAKNNNFNTEIIFLNRIELLPDLLDKTTKLNSPITAKIPKEILTYISFVAK